MQKLLRRMLVLLLLRGAESAQAQEHKFNEYTGDHLNRVAFPLGGIGAGMFCLEGTGAISHVSLKHEMDFFHEPAAYAAICVKGKTHLAKVLEGPVPDWKIFGRPLSGRGAERTTYGLPRFQTATFRARFPFGEIVLRDSEIPLDVHLTGWSPFVPNDPDASSLPVAAIEYRFTNPTRQPVEAVFSFNTPNFMISNRPGMQGGDAIHSMENGFVLYQGPQQKLPTAEIYKNSQFTHRDPASGERVAGLLAEYFRNMNLEGAPELVRSETFVNREFTTEVVPGFPALNFSARWTGEISVPESGLYQFCVAGDDGYRLFLDDQLVFAKWQEQSETLTCEKVTLEKNKTYRIRLEYYQGRGEAVIRLGYGAFDPAKDSAGEAALAIFISEAPVVIDHSWFKGGWWDPMTLTWNNVQNARLVANPPQSGSSRGASVFVPLSLQPGEEKIVRLKFAWYVPDTQIRYGQPNPECSGEGCCPGDPFYKPWYASRFKNLAEVTQFWQKHYDTLRQQSEQFSQTFYDTNLPDEVVEAVAANLTILKSPTVLRQADGQLWAWEGCNDNSGCCAGSCTHVWNYAQAIPHLFPGLERSLRHTEFFKSQNPAGHQTFRSNLPISSAAHTFHAAADGQLGGIMKVYRDWRISGDDAWLKAIWPRVRQSLDYCIQTWDPREIGALEEPHHNTYDIEYWGPEGHCTSFYLGALAAAIKMGTFCGDDVARYQKLMEKGRRFLETELYNGEYFYQQVKTTGLKAQFQPVQSDASGRGYAAQAEMINQQGPKYQYGTGCLSDGVLGFWLARVCGMDDELADGQKIRSHLMSVYNYNLKADLFDHANVQRPSYATGHDGGLLLCTWPRGKKPLLPFVYSDEVWTGIEYQVAGHLIMEGMVKEGLEIVRTCRQRYDGRVRNPFNEYECGHWYARAMSSFGLIQALTGVRYDAVDKTLFIQSHIGDNFRSFLSTATGFASVGLDKGKPFIEVKQGDLWIKRCVVAGKEMPIERR